MELHCIILIVLIRIVFDIKMAFEINTCSYNIENKKKFKRDGLNLLNEVIKELGIEVSRYKIYYISKGSSSSGDCILHTDRFYVQMNLEIDWILVRSCDGLDDYIGKENHHYSYARLSREGYVGLSEYIKQCLEE